jgi:hypothetical protein
MLTAIEIEMIQSTEDEVPEVSQDSQVKIITETENERDLQEREAPALVSEAKSDLEDRHETVSNTTESTPDIFKSPERQETADKAPDIVMTVETASEVAPQTKTFHYQGVSVVEETQLEDSSGNSEDERPIVNTLSIKEKGISLTRQQIQDGKEGPLGERAIGVTIMKTFDGVQFTGKIDSFRTARKRFYYHVIYSDGDEEEFNEEVRGKRKRRKENRKRCKPQINKELSDTMLPKPGDKNVSAEAFGKLDERQKQVVAEKVNRKTKKVLCVMSTTIMIYI